MSSSILANRRAEINKLLKAKGINKTILAHLIFIETGRKYSLNYICKIVKGTRKAKKLIKVIQDILMS